LMSYGNYERFDWINTPCCPPNVVRLIASLGSYVYATGGDDLYVNLFVGNTAHVTIGNARVNLRQDSRYPWDGQVRIAVDPEQPTRFTAHVRIPGWAGNQVMPGGLYQFMDHRRDPVTLKINGEPIDAAMTKGFATIDRTWRRGDVIDLTLPMPVRRVIADPRVKDVEGRVALE